MSSNDTTSSSWWRTSTVYQVYPKSFNDTTGSGTGDIRGLTEKLDYLQHLGIDIVWLQPVYVSPQNDNGYDVADYYEINPDFGTMEDFDELLKGLKARDMKLMIDIVVNHSSTEHEWFKQARSSKDNPYRDYLYLERSGVGRRRTKQLAVQIRRTRLAVRRADRAVLPDFV
ncbi:glycosidase [Paenibacillus sp. PvP094]